MEKERKKKNTPMDDRKYCFVVGCGLVECEDHEEDNESALAQRALSDPSMFGLRLEYHDTNMPTVMAIQARCLETMPVLMAKLLRDGLTGYKLKKGTIPNDVENHLNKILDQIEKQGK